jgi:hypothetical protein
MEISLELHSHSIEASISNLLEVRERAPGIPLDKVSLVQGDTALILT